MIDAKETYKIATEAARGKAQEDVDWLENQIRKHAAKGEMGCWICEPIDTEVLYLLDDIGYAINDYSNDKDGAKYYISWLPEQFDTLRNEGYYLLL